MMKEYVPGTLWTVGTFMPQSVTKEQEEQLHALWLQPNPEFCRLPLNSEDIPDDLGRGWLKSTYMAASPATAAKFMMDIFGAIPQQPPSFPWPPQSNCTAVQWVTLP